MCAFQGCRALTSVKLPTDLTSIGDFAFQECESLESVELPDDLKIGNLAFDGCILTSLTIVSTTGSQTIRRSRWLTFDTEAVLKALERRGKNPRPSPPNYLPDHMAVRI